MEVVQQMNISTDPRTYVIYATGYEFDILY